jgi:hypothetical protein
VTAVESATGGDPTDGAKFLRRSLATVCAELAERGIDLSPTTLSRILREQDFRLRVNAKRLSGPYRPQRDVQFRYLQEQMREFLEAGAPVISVDTKKKELIGAFAQAGVKWGREAQRVNDHDFRSDALCKAVPYGVYDVPFNHGLVTVGVASDTPAFAVAAIRAWWVRFGCKRYPQTGELLILADAGGSNGYRPRLWKWALQEQIADRYGLEVTVCHYPTGASKWNPIEHRLFGPISVNWAGEPLRTLERMLGLIRGARTETGLRVDAVLDERPWAAKGSITKAQMQNLQIEHHGACPQWNYTLRPRTVHLLN